MKEMINIFLFILVIVLFGISIDLHNIYLAIDRLAKYHSKEYKL